MKKILGILALAAIVCTGRAFADGAKGNAPAKKDGAASDSCDMSKMHDCCKKMCEDVKAHPGKVGECCGEFCASHQGKDGKTVEMACHLKCKGCAESFAHDGKKECDACQKAHAGKEKAH